jgi:hypothetical protein
MEDPELQVTERGGEMGRKNPRAMRILQLKKEGCTLVGYSVLYTDDDRENDAIMIRLGLMNVLVQ